MRRITLWSTKNSYNSYIYRAAFARPRVEFMSLHLMNIDLLWFLPAVPCRLSFVFVLVLVLFFNLSKWVSVYILEFSGYDYHWDCLNKRKAICCWKTSAIHRIESNHLTHIYVASYNSCTHMIYQNDPLLKIGNICYSLKFSTYEPRFCIWTQWRYDWPL